MSESIKKGDILVYRSGWMCIAVTGSSIKNGRMQPRRIVVEDVMGVQISVYVDNVRHASPVEQLALGCE